VALGTGLHTSDKLVLTFAFFTDRIRRTGLHSNQLGQSSKGVGGRGTVQHLKLLRLSGHE
jgi:hypothetical protein